MTAKQSIPCPVCQTAIEFDVQGMLQGKKFTCPNCNSSIGLQGEDQNIVNEAMTKFEKLKKDSGNADTP